MKADKMDEIIKTAGKYVNDGTLNVTNFRRNDSNTYAAIPYYFNSVNELVNTMGLKKTKRIKTGDIALRDKLAYSLLILMRKQFVLDAIGKKYNVSRALIRQQMIALEKNINDEFSLINQIQYDDLPKLDSDAKLRDKLAYDMITLFKKHNLKPVEIARDYNVAPESIVSLYRKLNNEINCFKN